MKEKLLKPLKTLGKFDEHHQIYMLGHIFKENEGI